MRDSTTTTDELQQDQFDFPCSPAFRAFSSGEDHRTSRLLARVPLNSDEEEAQLLIRDLLEENFRLRAALDITRLCRMVAGRPAPAHPHARSEGIPEHE